MASTSQEVELEQKEPLYKPEASDPIPSDGQGASNEPDPVTGNADVLTMQEFRGKTAQEGAKSPNDAEAGSAAPNKGFGGSWKCALVLTIGLVLAIIFTIVIAVTSSTLGNDNPTEGKDNPTEGARDEKSDVYQQAAVVSDVETCSILGKNILQQGGSAVDAAITSQLCVGLVNAQSSGLGGGFFMVISDADSGTTAYLDARESAPLAANDAFAASQLAAGSPYGINNTAIPGEVHGLWEAHQRYGKLPWADLFTPVIKLAENGYKATSHLEITLGRLAEEKPLSSYMGDWGIYTLDNGEPKRAGDLIRNIALANTLRAIAANGSDEFYAGETARNMIDEIQAYGGIMTMADLAGYSATWGDALTSPLGDDMTLVVPSMPSGGPVLQFLVNVMQSFNLTRKDFTSEAARTRTYHRFLEASKFAFGLQSQLGDVITLGVQQALSALSSMDYARDVAASVSDNEVTFTNGSYYKASQHVSTTLGGTSHVNVLAANGDAVLSTTSVNYRFGSKIRSPATGIIYNNEMADFSLIPSSPNYVQPSKRPLSSMCGCLVLAKDGRVKMVEGSAGSKRIITVNAWILLSTLLGEVPLSQAIDERRVHAQVNPEIYEDHEEDFNANILSELKSLGHSFTPSRSFSVVQAILQEDDGDILAYSDPRKGGKPAGY